MRTYWLFIGALCCQSLLGLEIKPSEIRAKTTEKPVAVLQKRFFEKSLRPEFGLLSGGFLNEAFTKTEKRGIRTALFFTEWMGLELQFIDTSVTNSEDRRGLDEMRFKKVKYEEGEKEIEVSPQPQINRVHQMIDLSLIAAPFYGKLNLFDAMIVYIDTYLVLGGASLDTDQGDKIAIATGIGQRYYFFKSFSLRVDFRNHTFTEERSKKQTTKNQQSWDLGLSWFFL